MPNTPHEGGEADVTSILFRRQHKLVPTKSLSFGSGVYESEERSPSELSRLNMRGLDEVLQELRDAHHNVSSAAQAAERHHRVHGFSTSYYQQSQSNVTAKNASPTPVWSHKRGI